MSSANNNMIQLASIGLTWKERQDPVGQNSSNKLGFENMTSGTLSCKLMRGECREQLSITVGVLSDGLFAVSPAPHSFSVEHEVLKQMFGLDFITPLHLPSETFDFEQGGREGVATSSSRHHLQ